MDKRAMIIDHLTQAEEHVALGKQHIEDQQRILLDLTTSGLDTAAASELLSTFLATQSEH